MTRGALSVSVHQCVWADVTADMDPSSLSGSDRTPFEKTNNTIYRNYSYMIDQLMVHLTMFGYMYGTCMVHVQLHWP